MQLMKKKKKEPKKNKGTSHHMMFWTPEYCPCYKAPLLKKKKKKGTKETKKESEINMGTGKDNWMYVYFIVRFCKTQKPNFCPTVIAASLINNLLEAPSVQSHITSSSLSVGSQVL